VDTPQAEILLISGPAGVGKSTLSHELGAQLREAGVSHVILDCDELDRAWPLTPPQQEAPCRTNLAAFWANASALGHTRLILVGVFVDPDADRLWIDAARRDDDQGRPRCNEPRARTTGQVTRDRVRRRGPALAHARPGPGDPPTQAGSPDLVLGKRGDKQYRWTFSRMHRG
jgi:hypothetical protein